MYEATGARLPSVGSALARRLAQYQAAMQYFGADGLGSVRQIYDASGAVVGSTRYDPFGNAMAHSGATSVFAFAGEQYDAGTGLEYLRARYYSSAQGRFTTRDVWEGDPNAPMSYNGWLYAYANAVRFTDPSGHDPLDAAWRGWFKAEFKRDPTPDDEVIKLFSLAYPDEYRYEGFYNSDRSLKPDFLERVFANPPTSRSWNTLPKALVDLSRSYRPNEKSLFVHDVAVLWAGFSTRSQSEGRIPYYYLLQQQIRLNVWLRPEGLNARMVDNNMDGNVHHWAAFFAAGYEFGAGLSQDVNFCREWLAGPQQPGGRIWQREPSEADLLLGDEAAREGHRFWEPDVTYSDIPDLLAGGQGGRGQ